MEFSRKDLFLFGLMLGLVLAIPLSWVAHAMAWLLIWAIGIALILMLAMKWLAAKFRIP